MLLRITLYFFADAISLFVSGGFARTVAWPLSNPCLSSRVFCDAPCCHPDFENAMRVDVVIDS